MTSTADLESPAYLDFQDQRLQVPASRTRAADAFRLARAHFDAGEGLDMVCLAKELGVGRATLYRWSGNRERLLADVMWSAAEELFQVAFREASGVGKAALSDGLRITLASLASSAALRKILRDDNDIAMYILTRRKGYGVQERAVAYLAGIIAYVSQTSAYEPKIPGDTLAYAIVRIIEGFIYSDLSAGCEPDLAAAQLVIEQLL